MNNVIDCSQTDLLLGIIKEANEKMIHNNKIDSYNNKEPQEEIITIFDIVGLIVNEIDRSTIKE